MLEPTHEEKPTTSAAEESDVEGVDSQEEVENQKLNEDESQEITGVNASAISLAYDDHRNDNESGRSSCDNPEIWGIIFSGGDSFRTSDNEPIDDVRCLESLPGSDSNKENVDSNLNNGFSDFDSTDSTTNDLPTCSRTYDNSDNIPLQQLLKIHSKTLVSGFEFGEATKRRAQENMKSARDKNLSERRQSGELTTTMTTVEDYGTPTDLDKPCCSKYIPEVTHKTPHSRKRQRLAEIKSQIANSDDFCRASRRIPVPLRDYPDSLEVWIFMVYKEEAMVKLRNPRLFNDFKSVTPRMRAILLDWLMEVAEVYHLRRVTYYLSVDYFDRFLSIRPDIPKSLLQLVGITCLYIAAKVEEIYPPNLSEFSYVCDGACKSSDMISCELLVLNSLGWEVVLTTPTDWLNLYMQLHFKGKELLKTTLNMDFNKDFIFPQYSAYQFTRASQIMDLLTLDPGYLRFSYSIIAAAAMYFMFGKDIALAVSGLTMEQLQPCTDYMEVFYLILKDAPDPRLRSCLGGPHPEDANRPSGRLLNNSKNGPNNENYSFQTHVASMEYFEKATIYRLSKMGAFKKTSNNNVEDVSNNNSELLDEAAAFAPTPDKDNEKSVIADCPDFDDANGLLDVLTNGGDTPNTESLMSLDEIFEMILNQEEEEVQENSNNSNN